MTDKTDAGPAPLLAGKNRELWVGLFVILGVGLTMTLLFTLTDAAMFRGRYIVTTHLPTPEGSARAIPCRCAGSTSAGSSAS